MTTLDKMLQGLANALGASLSTLTTTAKTVVGAINELKSGLTTANTNISTNTTKIGTGSLNTTAQTIIPAINELKGLLPKHIAVETYTASINHGQTISNAFSVTGPALVLIYDFTITGNILVDVYTPSGTGFSMRCDNTSLYSRALSYTRSNNLTEATASHAEKDTTIVVCRDNVTFSLRNAAGSNDGSVTIKYAVIEF